MSWEANEWARRVRTGDATLKGLLIALSNYVNEDRECWHSQQRIAFDTEIPIRTLRRKLEALVALGLIEMTGRTRDDGTKTTNLIRLLIGPQPEAIVAGGQQSSGQKAGVASGQNWGVPAATCVAEQESSGILNESSKRVHAREAESIFAERFWPNYPKRFGSNPKEPARAKFIAAVVSGENPQDILAGLARLIHDLRAQDRIGSQFVPQAVTWLNQKRWKDDPGPQAPHPPRNEPKPRPSLFGAALDVGRRARDDGPRFNHDGGSRHPEQDSDS